MQTPQTSSSRVSNVAADDSAGLPQAFKQPQNGFSTKHLPQGKPAGRDRQKPSNDKVLRKKKTCCMLQLLLCGEVDSVHKLFRKAYTHQLTLDIRMITRTVCRKSHARVFC
jgi:hypothetical protein